MGRTYDTVSLLTDYGLDDEFVGVLKAVLRDLAPHATAIDITHGIRPYDVRGGAIIASIASFQLPDVIHMVVVDPGVGSARRALCLRSRAGTVLIGPDNGVLVPAAQRGGGVECAFELDTRGASPTFHARDVFSLTAGRLACGAAPEDVGVGIDPASLVTGPFGLCERMGDHVVGEVLEADRFGSLRLNVPSESLDVLGLSGDTLEIAIGHNALKVPRGLTFADVGEGEPVIVADSSGWLTLAVNQGSASDRYGISAGSRVVLRISL